MRLWFVVLMVMFAGCLGDASVDDAEQDTGSPRSGAEETAPATGSGPDAGEGAGGGPAPFVGSCTAASPVSHTPIVGHLNDAHCSFGDAGVDDLASYQSALVEIIGEAQAGATGYYALVQDPEEIWGRGESAGLPVVVSIGELREWAPSEVEVYVGVEGVAVDAAYEVYVSLFAGPVPDDYSAL